MLRGYKFLLSPLVGFGLAFPGSVNASRSLSRTSRGLNSLAGSSYFGQYPTAANGKGVLLGRNGVLSDWQGVGL